MMGFALTKAEPSAEPVSLAEAKSQCSVDVDDWDDEFFAWAIPAARQAAEQHTSRVFATCDVTERHDDFPRFGCAAREPSDVYLASAIRLQMPAATITAVKYYDAAGTEQTLVADTDYLVALDRVPSLVYPAPGKVWPAAVQFGRLLGVTVTYTAAVDSRVKLAKAAMLMIIAHWFTLKDGVGDDTGKDITQLGIPAGAWRILNGPLMRPMYT